MQQKTRHVKNLSNKGKIGEKLALRFLRQKGFKLIVNNYRIPGGEIDLVLQKDGILFFVEVKTRWTKNFGLAEEGLTIHQKKRLLKAIYTYLQSQKKIWSWRCDLVAIQFANSSQATIKHFTDIFTA